VNTASASVVASGTPAAVDGTVVGQSSAAAAFVVRRWWSDCFVNNKLHWRERAVIGQ